MIGYYDWRPFLTFDSAAGTDNGEWLIGTSTAPTQGDLIYRIDSIHIKWTAAAATAGNRVPQVLYLDSDEDIIARAVADTEQAANGVRYWNFYTNAEMIANVRDTDYISAVLPDIILPNNWSLKVMDADSVAADSDILEIAILGRVATCSNVTT